MPTGEPECHACVPPLLLLPLLLQPLRQLCLGLHNIHATGTLGATDSCLPGWCGRPDIPGAAQECGQPARGLGGHQARGGLSGAQSHARGHAGAAGTRGPGHAGGSACAGRGAASWGCDSRAQQRRGPCVAGHAGAAGRAVSRAQSDLATGTCSLLRRCTGQPSRAAPASRCGCCVLSGRRLARAQRCAGRWVHAGMPMLSDVLSAGCTQAAQEAAPVPPPQGRQCCAWAAVRHR